MRLRGFLLSRGTDAEMIVLAKNVIEAYQEIKKHLSYDKFRRIKIETAAEGRIDYRMVFMAYKKSEKYKFTLTELNVAVVGQSPVIRSTTITI